MITWESITNEVQEHEGYREALVRVFRRYEGQDTDERDGSNRVVQVTAASFARHFGIAQKTFHRWVNPPPMEVNMTTTSRPEQGSNEVIHGSGSKPLAQTFCA